MGRDRRRRWTLPASRNKVKVDLIRPLSPSAQAVLDKLPRIGKRGFVFTTGGDRPIGGFSKFKRALRQGLRRDGMDAP